MLVRTAASIKSECAILLLVALLVSCSTASGILPQEKEEEIPDEANLVIVRSSESPESITEAYETQLEEDDFTFAHRGDRSLETHPKSVGDRTLLKVEAEAQPTSEGSELLIRGYWGRPSTGAAGALAGVDEDAGTAEKRAFWVEKGAWGRAFAFLVLTADDLPGEMDYQEE